MRVIYADGTEKVVRVDRVLDAKRSATVELSGAPLETVVIDTEPKSRAMYSVHAAAQTTGVASR
ncbi:MAG TPA: hypothetical protein VK427_21820 [Kofleriaceae bacterium]|nr:hypothetical protein [Kofleriaceae bacterium]